MMRPALTLAISLFFAGCVGEAEFQLGGPAKPVTDGPGDMTPVQVSTFQGLSEGLPATRLSGSAQLDGVLYAVAEQGLYALPSGTNKWVQVELPSRASAVTRIDTEIYVTAADGTHGGLFHLGFGDDAFAALASAPDAAAYALVKKGSELLLATASGLYASKDRGATWAVRSTNALFNTPVSTLVASAAATRIFALGNGKLWHSDDAGATWASGLVAGTVKAVEAAGEFALVQTATGALRSDNYGNTFKSVDIGAAAQSFAVSGKRAFAGTMAGMRVSDDGGAVWRDASAGLPSGAPVMQIFLSGAALIASTGEAVYVAQVQ